MDQSTHRNSFDARIAWANCSHGIKPIGRTRRPGVTQKLLARTLLQIRRLAAVRQPERQADATLLARGGLSEPFRKRLGRLDREVAVEHEKLLLRHGRHGAAVARHIGVGEVEQHQ